MTEPTSPTDALLELVADAHTITRDWYADYIDPDDLRSELTTYAIQQRQPFERWIESDEPHRVLLALKSAARIYGTREKARALGYAYEDVAWYTPEGLAQLIPFALDDKWDGLTGERGDAEMPGGAGPASEGGTLLAMVIDIRRILAPGVWSVTDFDSESEAGVERLEWLAEKLGGQRPEAPGYRQTGRRAVSNAQGQQMVRDAA